MDEMLYNRLAPVVRRIRFRRVATGLAIVWLIAAAVGLGLMYLNRIELLDPSRYLGLLIGGTVVGSVMAIVIGNIRTKSVGRVAEELERRYPDLDSSLITAIEQTRGEGKRLGFLQQDVLRKAVTHSYVNPWPTIIPGWHLIAAPLAGAIGLMAFGVAMICLTFFAVEPPIDSSIAFADAAVEKANYVISVEPGNTEVERGSSLLVLARFAHTLPPDANLVLLEESGEETELAMSKSLDDPVFGARISTVRQPLTYRVDFAQQQSETFEVSVFEFPELIRADVTLQYPAYTELKEKTIQDVRRVSAVEGTMLNLTLFVNKPVASAWLLPKNGQPDDGPIELVADATDPKKLTTQIRMERSQKYDLELLDDANRENRTPPKFVFTALENRIPDLKLLAPSRDVQASPLEEIQLSANAWDDFGLKSFGLSYGIAGQDEQDIVLKQKTDGKKRERVDYLLELEQLKAQPDDLVSYFFWADDIGPDGQSRRTMSDLYFAEVRHFEEIFRQGQAPPGGQQQQQQQQQGTQNAQAAQELAELQKQIINANWKLIRRESEDNPSAEFGDDTELLIQSQSEAKEQLAKLAEDLEDDQSKAYVESIRTFMNGAILDLTRANRDGEVSALNPALSQERSAYQGLLKLRAREHEVVLQQQQQQSAQSSQQQNNRAQQQLDQLNLKEDENRYENQRTAQQQTEQAKQQQEVRQVLSRLRELARRQKDLNERVKELQAALEEAKTKEEKEEIDRRLKSLREQQEQILRDTDELAQRMQDSENQQQMTEETEQLGQTRENQQRAAEALKQNEISRAAAEGTRAQRDLEELRDEFQNRSSGQFTEQMRQMRNEAQKLERNQQDIGQKLSDQPESETKSAPSLRGADEEEPDLRQQLADQQQAVKELREQMKQTIEEAEPFEPLLAEDLYDTYRESEVSRTEQALESTRRSLDRGWVDDAKGEEERARQGIEQMREGIEQAAERVLGDETKALKEAQETLKGLNRELNEEISNRDSEQDGTEAGPGEAESEADGTQRGRQPGSENESGQPGQPGENQADRQPGNQRPENQPNADEDNRSSQGSSGDQPGQNQQEGNQSSNDQREQEGQPSQEGQRSPGGQDQRDGQREGSNPGGDGQPQSGQETGAPAGQSGNASRPPTDDEQRDADAERLRQQMRELGANQPATENQRGGGMPQSGGGNQRMLRPISGDDFRDWSDRLRDVEEMIADPDLRAQASRIREKAREIRREMKRHSAEPNWDLVKMKVAKPLAELQDRVSEEILRRSSKDALVPLDRDPVPTEFQDAVRKYYERLGSGQ